MDGVRIVSNPLLQRHNGILRRRGATPKGEAWSGADAVLLSHLHHDHAELASFRMFARSAGADVTGERGLGGEEGSGRSRDRRGGVDGRRRAGDVAVRLVRAVHHSRPMPHRPNAAHGHLVRGPVRSRLARGRHRPVPGDGTPPGGGRRPGGRGRRTDRWMGARLSPGHLGPKQAARRALVAELAPRCRCTGGPCTCRSSDGSRAAGWRSPGRVRGGGGRGGAGLPAARAGRRIVGHPALTGPDPGLIRCG